MTDPVITRRVQIRRAREVSERFRRYANQVRCAGNLATDEKQAGRLEREAEAIDYLIRIAEATSDGEPLCG